MQENQENKEIISDDTYFVELELISTILKVGENKRNDIEDNKRFGNVKNVLEFISRYNITSEHFHDPTLRAVFEYIQKSTTDSESLDTPSILEIEAKFPDVTASIGNYANNVSELMDRANEAKLFHQLANTLSKTSELIQNNSNTGLAFLQSQLDNITSIAFSRPYNIIKDAEDRWNRRQRIINHEELDPVPTGFPELDRDIHGLANEEEFFVMFARTGVGKAQPLDSKVLTRRGYIRMRDVKEGQKIVTGTGELGRVAKIFPQGVIDVYTVTFEDSSGNEYSARCSYQHLWKVKASNADSYEVIPMFRLKELIESADLDIEYYVDFVHPRTLQVYPLYYKLRSISYEGKEECQCLMIDHPDHTYVTNKGIVTHNTWTMLQVLHEAWRSGRDVALIEPEMSPQLVGYRFDTLANRGKFSNSALMFGQTLDDGGESEYKAYITDLSKSNRQFLCVHPNYFGDRLTVSMLKTFCKQNKIQVLGIDGLSYMFDERGRSSDSTTTALTHIAADLMSLSIELKLPVIAIVQSNRENGVAQGGKLSLDNIRDSDGIAYAASKVCGLYVKQGALHVQLLKSRFGPVGKIYAYDWNVDKGTYGFLGYGDVEDEDFGMDDNGAVNAHSYTPVSRSSNSQPTRVMQRDVPNYNYDEVPPPQSAEDVF